MSVAARVLAVCFCAVLLLGGLTATDLIRNEGLRARLASEAMASGDWLVPSLAGEPHLSKPPGMSVAIAVCSIPAGRVTDVTARLPSVLAAALTLALWAWTFRRLCGPSAGWVALVVMPCSWLWLDRVPSAEIDLVQLAWVSGAMLFLLRAMEDPLTPPPPLPPRGEGEPETGAGSVSDGPSALPPPLPCVGEGGRGGEGGFWWLAAMLCVAGGLFTKWTAPAFFYLAAVPWLLWRGRLASLLRWPHLAGATIVAVLAVGWLCWAASSAGWQTLTDTLEREALMRFSPAHHPRPYPYDELLTFPLSFVVGCLPWALVAAVSLLPAFVRTLDDRQRQLWRLCQCWLWVNLIFWTLAPGHRPRHILPAQPAVAALAVLVWHAWLSGRLRWPLPRVGPRPVLVGLLVGWLVVKLVFVAHVLPRRQATRRPREAGEALAALVPAEQTLHVVRLKDDGVLFYYGRPTRRLSSPQTLPAAGWCVVTEAEWLDWPGAVVVSKCAELHDGQGAKLVLLRGETGR